MKQNISLAMLSSGEKAIIVSIRGGRDFAQRISDIGLYTGSKIEIIRNDFSYPIIIKILDSRIVLGRGQAQKIFTNLIIDEKNN